jgi:hypothetical protein
MPAVVYTVTVSLPDEATAARWLKWIGPHAAEVLAGGAASAEVTRTDGPPLTFAVAYHFPSREALAGYERDHAPRLRDEGRRLFAPEAGVVYQRSVAEVVLTIRDPS